MIYETKPRADSLLGGRSLELAGVAALWRLLKWRLKRNKSPIIAETPSAVRCKTERSALYDRAQCAIRLSAVRYTRLSAVRYKTYF